MRIIRLLVISAWLWAGAAFAMADQPPAQSPDGGTAEAVNLFTTDLFPHLAQGQGNLVYSPLSVYMALSMTAAGARGDTAKEMSAELHVPDASSADFQADAGKLFQQLQSSQRNFQLRVANAIWGQEGFNCLPAFQEILQKDYDTELLHVDFRAVQRACGTINDWVLSHTQGKIAQLFSPGNLPANTQLALVSAIYFKANWQLPFSPDQTRSGPFHVGGSSQTEPRTMMHRRGVFGYLDNDQFQALELPYEGDKTSMLILLPRSVDGVQKLQSDFSAKSIADVVRSLQPTQVQVELPKFKLFAQADLSPALAAMGMRKAFTLGEADFSGIDGLADLFISNIQHKAFISVDEAGTEAAAATGIVFLPTFVMANQHVFSADHPFLLVIRDRASGAMLFVSRVEDPVSN